MHPILARGRLPLYLLVWTPFILLVAGLLVQVGGWTLAEATAFAVPMVLIYAFLCLAAWFPSRQAPLRATGLWKVAANHVPAALLTVSLWQLAGGGLAVAIGTALGADDLPARFGQQVPLLVALGLMVYLLAAAASYVALAIASSQRAERAALEAQRDRDLAAREMELARALQQRLLPPPRADGPGWRLAARNLPAGFVAGDLYDHGPIDGADAHYLAVADVAGKGVTASLITATVKAVLPLLAAARTPAETVAALNAKLHAELSAREFVALALARYQPASGHVTLINAGLPDAYRLRIGRPAEALDAPQPRLPIGLRPQVGHVAVEHALAPGDVLLLLTDGPPEAPGDNGEPIGYEAFEGLLDALGAPRDDDDLDDWLDRLLERVAERSGTAQRQDDWTVLALQHLPR
ncbi:MAG: PP2C family protein-serine/threonine phosphatase [Acidobacteriota bacterium]